MHKKKKKKKKYRSQLVATLLPASSIWKGYLCDGLSDKLCGSSNLMYGPIRQSHKIQFSEFLSAGYCVSFRQHCYCPWLFTSRSRPIADSPFKTLGSIQRVCARGTSRLDLKPQEADANHRNEISPGRSEKRRQQIASNVLSAAAAKEQRTKKKEPTAVPIWVVTGQSPAEDEGPHARQDTYRDFDGKAYKFIGLPIAVRRYEWIRMGSGRNEMHIATATASSALFSSLFPLFFFFLIWVI